MAIALSVPPKEIDPKSGVHTISLYVNDKPGVLVRVALVFSRRATTSRASSSAPRLSRATHA
jgi:acetolactate synthase small subunit